MTPWATDAFAMAIGDRDLTRSVVDTGQNMIMQVDHGNPRNPLDCSYLGHRRYGAIMLHRQKR